MTAVSEGIHKVRRSPLYRNSAFLIGAAALSYGMGFAFWLIVARLYPASSVGIAVTLISTILFLANVASLGLGFGLVRFLPTNSVKIGLVNYALTLSALASGVLGIAFLAGVDLWAPSLQALVEDTGLALVFLASTTGSAVASILDQTFVATRRADYSMLRMAVYNVLRLPLPVALATSLGVMSIALSWTIPLVISIGFGLGVLMPRVLPGFVPNLVATQPTSSRVVRYSLWNQGADLVGGASTALLPLLIVNAISGPQGASAAAYFYAALSFASLLYIVPAAFSTSLFVEGSHSTGTLVAESRRALRVSLSLMAIGIVASIVAGNWVLALFGPAYSVESYPAFIVLIFASPIILANSVMTTHLRVNHRLGTLLIITTASMLSTFAAAAFFVGSAGIVGVAFAFVSGQSVGLGMFAFDAWWNRRTRPTVLSGPNEIP